MKDLVVLAADKNIEHTLKGLFARPQSLGIQPIETDIFIEPEHDPACALRGVSFLANFSKEYKFALLVFDHEGSGKESVQAHELQEGINAEFANSTWGGERARAVVLAPELETWVWSDSPHVDEITGWKNRQPGLRPWLTEQGWLQEGQVKPEHPKEAFEAALRKAQIPRSSSLYRQIAEKVSLEKCTDKIFKEFREILQVWFQGMDRHDQVQDR